MKTSICFTLHEKWDVLMANGSSVTCSQDDANAVSASCETSRYGSPPSDDLSSRITVLAATGMSMGLLLAHSQLGLEDACSIRQSESAIPIIQSLSMSCSMKRSCASGEPWTSSARGQTATVPTRSRQIPFAAPHRIAWVLLGSRQQRNQLHAMLTIALHPNAGCGGVL